MSPGTGVRVPEYPALLPPIYEPRQQDHGGVQVPDKGIVAPTPPGNFSPLTPTIHPYLARPAVKGLSYASNQTDYNTLLQRLLQYQQMQNQQQQAAPPIAPAMNTREATA